MWGYDHLPNLERKVGGKLYDWFGKDRTKIEQLRNKRRGIVKQKS